MTDQPTYSRKVIEIADWLLKNTDKKISVAASVFCSKFQKTERTIWNYITQAQEYNKSRLRLEQKAKNEVLIAEAKQSLKKAIMSRNELLEFYSKEIQEYIDIKTGKAKVKRIGDKIILPTFKDAKEAGAEIAKLLGYYMPDKQAITDSQGMDLPQTIKVTLNL